MSKLPFMVFTDLDGTLLDHQTYCYDAALPALDRLRDMAIPVVLASSKTGPEVAALRAELRLDASPAIVENGAGLLAPHQSPDTTSTTYARLRTLLDGVSPDLRQSFRGFADMGPEGVAENAGLTLPAARMACQRTYSEPGIWSGTPDGEEAFVAALAQQGIAARRGGRYLTLSFGGTKADSMKDAAQLFGNPTLIALGDAPNDVEMLETADIGVIISNAHATPLPELAGEPEGRILRSTKFGPEGWNEMMQKLISRLAAQ
ncbi:HAD-IIB family hydrolase [Pseudooceanicola sediminis]|uniref:HAD-IIB family hydrolase n=1 Tax=Pseudooceanicola sediminis TaxID=2211117 RepID=A0A399IYW1_9RHOB|nr:HAD-IIB family hydrolase [Pseudooceanicola sediminis]KAA2316080.1 HAD-IIB family hydrolase [Puniceibacterium sp. HSS470]RII38190.1 HAD-IIB family hydrolase [Pseudooceanicola sediminis]|tara:strand:+ start:50353 stop:51135 length:783 start_codon:yes stop_codon:yes gene_type:complete